MSGKYLILDRDGVINQDSSDYIKSPEEWIDIPGSIEAIARLSKAGWRVAVATNQSGVGRGLFNLNALGAMHDKMLQKIKQAGGQLEAIVFCPHHPEEGCCCRKPKPGLLHQLRAEHGFELSPATYMVGDAQRDLEAAIEAGITPVLVETGKGTLTKQRLTLDQDLLTMPSLSDFADHLLNIE